MSSTGRSRPQRLMEAHELLTRERPPERASEQAWLSYYQRSASIYRAVAETDRGHHHEALYWSSREERKANEIEERLRKR